MPELPEVHNVMLSLENKIVRKTIIKAEVYLDKIIKQKQTPEIFKERAIGSIITRLKRRGKYLIATLKKDNLEDEMYMIVHLGMTGAWFAVKSLDDIDEKFRKHTHCVLTLNDETLLAYCDIRRFGGLRIFDKKQMTSTLATAINKMGPEPFDDNAEEIYLKNIKKKLYRNKKAEDGAKYKEPILIKEAILDQNIIAGVGNIYACEALLKARILPDKPVVNLNDIQLRNVFRAARDIMKFSISVGGSSISDYVNGEGKSGQMQNYLQVYQQKSCSVCGDNVVKSTIGGRGTFHCPSCQS